MRALVLSASNVSTSGRGSASLLAAEELAAGLRSAGREAEVLDLRGLELPSCTMCERCADSALSERGLADWACAVAPDFARAAAAMARADELLFVVPHYAGLPSKLASLLERLEELCYLRYCGESARNAAARRAAAERAAGATEGAAADAAAPAPLAAPFAGKRAGLLVHGGMTEGFAAAYRANLAAPLLSVFASMGLATVHAGPEGVPVFGVAGYGARPGGTAAAMVHDEAGRRAAVEALLRAVLEGAAGAA